MGESLLRMEKRMSCAASGLGIRLSIEVRKDAEALGIPFQHTPTVMHEDKVIFCGLRRTEEIEEWLNAITANSRYANPVTDHEEQRIDAL
jgi:hypothetical protein